MVKKVLMEPEFINQKKFLAWGFYPDISKDIRVISKHKGWYK